MYLTTHTTTSMLPFTDTSKNWVMSKFISWLLGFSQNIAFIERHIGEKKKICYWEEREIAVSCIQPLSVVPKWMKSCITVYLQTQNWCLPRKASNLSRLRQKVEGKTKILESANSKSIAHVDSASDTVEPVTHGESLLSNLTSPLTVLAHNRSY